MWPFKTRAWCCRQFQENLASEEMQRGASIQIVRPGPSHHLPMGFFLRFRAIDDASKGLFDGIPTPAPVCLETHVGLLYCPWCGVDLRMFYRGRSDLPLIEPSDFFGEYLASLRARAGLSYRQILDVKTTDFSGPLDSFGLSARNILHIERHMPDQAKVQHLRRAHERPVVLEFTIQGKSTTIAGKGRCADGQLYIDVKDDAGDFMLCLDEAKWDGEMIESGNGYLIRLRP